MRAALSSALAVAVSMLLGCGGSEGASADEDFSKLSFEMAAIEVPAGESFTCVYTDVITDRELSVIAATGTQQAGGHHLTLYYVDNPREPHSAPCSGSTEMIDWHFVVGAGGEGNDGAFLDLADGLAIKIPAGKQLLIQAHYINTTGEAMTATDTMEIHTVDPSRVKAYASDFLVFDDSFEIAPNAAEESSMTCLVEEDVQLSILLGHMHEQGAHYKLESVDAEGNALETLYEEAWSPAYASHPPIQRYTMEDPLVIKAGTRLRQTCKWNNTTPDLLLFPTEMCIGFGYYFPGNSRLMCERTEEQAAP